MGDFNFPCFFVHTGDRVPQLSRLCFVRIMKSHLPSAVIGGMLVLLGKVKKALIHSFYTPVEFHQVLFLFSDETS